MSKVALRVYNREIETLVDQGHIDEAVSHCMHILKSFPKHLETYRLMGKAYLEAHRYSDAADIFQRVLLAAPDDFVSHLGMSIVFDEQNDLPSAIWHMERAFEINSTNGGVQSELRRLYSRRDGLEPPKIHLTRGALAQIYAKGGEYQQAIAEVKSVLADEENRSDMKTLLARCYFRVGMKNEAVELCMDLIKQYPYSLDGNRIMVEILPGTSMAPGVEQYRRRIHSLDPYAAATTASVFETDSIPDSAVMLERLDFNADSRPTEDWKKNSQQTGALVPDSSLTDLLAATEQIPDWMQASGWGPSNGEFREGPESGGINETEIESSPGELAAAEIPDWLRAMAPPGAVPASSILQESSSEETADFEWLASLGAPGVSVPMPVQPPSQAGQVIPTAVPLPDKARSDEGNLDWLDGISSPAKSAQPPGLDKSAPVENVADWLEAIDTSEPTAAPAGAVAAENVPDWLRELAPAESFSQTPAGNLPGPAEIPIPAGISESALVESSLDMQLDPADKLIEPVAIPPNEIVLEKPVSDQQDASEKLPNWASSPASPDSSSDENVPGWLRGLSASEPGPESASDQSIPSWLSDSPASQFSQEPAPQAAQGQGADDDIPAWLGSLSASQPVADQLFSNKEDESEQAPDWLKALSSQEPVPDSSGSTALPNWISSLSGSQPAGEPASESSLPDWLSNLATPESLLDPGESEKALGWLDAPSTEPEQTLQPRSSDDSMVQAAAFGSSEPELLSSDQSANLNDAASQPTTDESVPAWLRGISASQSVPEQVSGQADEIAPDWLSVLSSPAAGQASDEKAPDWLDDIQEQPGGKEMVESEADKALRWLQSLEPQVPVSSEASAPIAPITSSAPEPETSLPAAQEMGGITDESMPAAEQPKVESQTADWADQFLPAINAPEVSDSEQAEAFEWLDTLVSGQTSAATAGIAEIPEVPAETAETPAARSGDGFVPPPLSEIVSGPGTSQDEQEDALKWLESLALKQGAKAEELLTDPSERQETAPGWVSAVPAAAAGTPAASAGDGFVPPPLSEIVSGPGTSLDEQEDALKWLESLAQKQGAKAEELLTDPSQRQENAPGWVSAATAAAAETPAASAGDSFVPPPLSEIVTGPGTSQDEQEDALNWLESLALKQGAKAEELLTDPSQRQETAPGWVSAATAETAETPAASAGDGFVPPPLSEIVTGPGTSQDEQEDALKWLESLALKQGAKAEELLTDPSQRQETAPGWVSEPALERAVANPAVEPDALLLNGQESQDDSLDWQKEFSAEAPSLIANFNEQTPTAPPEDSLGWMNEYGTASAGSERQTAPQAQGLLAGASFEAQIPAPTEPVHEEAAAPIQYILHSESNLLDDSMDWRLEQSGEEPARSAHLIYHPTPEPPQDALGWLGEYGGASIGNIEALTQAKIAAESVSGNDDLDWLGDLSKPENEVAAPVISPSAQTVDGHGVYIYHSEIPDAPDVSLDWLTKIERDEKPDQEVVPANAVQPVEPIDSLAWALEPIAIEDQPAQTISAETQENLPGGIVDDLFPVSAQIESLAWKLEGQDETENSIGGVDDGVGAADWLAELQNPAVRLPDALPWEQDVSPADAGPLESSGESDVHGSLPENGAQTESKPGWLMSWDKEPVHSEAASTPGDIVGEEKANELTAWLQEIAALDDTQPTGQMPWEAAPPVVEPGESVAISFQSAGEDEISAWLQETAAHDEFKPIEALPLEQEQPALESGEVDAIPFQITAESAISDWQQESAVQDEIELPAQTPWEGDQLIPKLGEAQVAPSEAIAGVEIPAWLREDERRDESKPGDDMPWEADQPSEERSAAKPVLAETANESGGGDISEWLKSLDEPDLEDWDDLSPAVQSKAPSWLETMPAPLQENVPTEEELPDWLKESSSDDESSGAGTVSAWQSSEQEVSFENEKEDLKETQSGVFEQPEAIEIHQQEKGTASEISSLLRRPLPGGDREVLAVQKARDLLARGGLDSAMDEYVKLIRKGKMLEEVIYDLQEAVYSHPVDVIVWQTLGDAYMRSNRLQEALDAYSKAEELLR
jgi:tetratricopeptide (TPR) repeat protein